MRSAPPATRVSIRSGWRLKVTGRWARGAPRISPDARWIRTRRSPAGTKATGFEGLQTYIRGHREKDFVNNLSEKMLVYALGRSRLLSDEPLAGRDAHEPGRQRLQILFADRNHCHQPAVPEQTKSTDSFHGKVIEDARSNETPSTDRIARRAILRGAGVTMALPWLESFAAKAATTGAAVFPKRFGVVFLGCGVNEDHWGIGRVGRRDEAQQDAVASGAVEEQDQRDPWPLQQGRHGPGHSPSADRQSPDRRAPCSRAPSSIRASRWIR